MVKFLRYILALSLTLSLMGCGGEPVRRQSSICGATVSWEMRGREYSANIALDKCENTADAAGEYIPAAVTLTAPESISGTVIAYSGNTATASVGEVSFPLPDNMGREVYLIVLSLCPDRLKRQGAGESGGTAVRYTATVYGGTASFDITYGGDGYPSSARILTDGGELSVRYSDVAAK